MGRRLSIRMRVLAMCNLWLALPLAVLGTASRANAGTEATGVPAAVSALAASPIDSGALADDDRAGSGLGFVALTTPGAPDTRMIAVLPSVTAWFSPTGIVARAAGEQERHVTDLGRPAAAPKVTRIGFSGASRNATIEGFGLLPGVVHSLRGNDPSRWQTNLPRYAGIRVRGLYPGIDLECTAHTGEILCAAVGVADGREAPVPLAIDGEPAPIPSAVFSVGAEVRTGNEALASRAATSRLPIPVSGARSSSSDHAARVAFSTYLGGSGDERVGGIARGAGDSLVVAGTTTSIDFPGASAGRASSDVFVVRLASDGQTLLSMSIIGGADSEWMLSSVGSLGGPAMTTDSSGAIYMTGFTASDDFPTTAGSYIPAKPSGATSFITKLDPTGSTAVYSTYVAGAWTTAISVHEDGGATVVGEHHDGFRVVRPIPGAGGLGSDAFVLHLNPAGTSVTFASRLGSSGPDTALSVAAAAGGVVYVAGSTGAADFPIVNAAQPVHGGSDGCYGDAFIARLDVDNASLAWSTFLGGSGPYGDIATGVAVNPRGGVVVVGATSSRDLPLLHPLQDSPPETGMWPFAAGYAGDGTRIFATHLSGSTAIAGGPPSMCVVWSAATGVAADDQGRAWLTGFVIADDFPLVSAVQPIHGGGYDAFLAVLAPGGSALLLSTYMGGEQTDLGAGLALLRDRSVVLTGTTAGSFPTVNALFPSFGGRQDAFLTRIDLGALLVDVTATAAPASGPAPLTVSLRAQATGGSPPYTYAWELGDGTLYGGENPVHTYSAAGVYTAKVVATDSAGATAQAEVVITATSACAELTCRASVPLAGQVGRGVAFSGGVSGCGSPASYAWSFGDGSSSSGEAPIHAYTAPGSVRWTMTVTAGGRSCARSGTVLVTAAEAETTLVVPAVAHLAGVGGSQWRTDLVAANPTNRPAAVTLAFVGIEPPRLVTTNLGAGASVEWPDVLLSLFALPAQPGRSGTVHVIADGEVMATARTYNAGKDGTFGQEYPALSPGDGIAAGETGLLLGLKKSAAYRTNVGLVALAGGDAAVRVSLFGADAAALGTPLLVQVPAGRWLQLDDVFARLGASAAPLAYATIEAISPGTRVWAYASVIDNATHDPVTVGLIRRRTAE